MNLESFTPREVFILAVAGVIILIVLRAWFGRWWADRTAARRTARRFAKGNEGELLAEALLRESGYTILERQHQGSWTLLIDDEPQTVWVYADFLVEDEDGVRLIAEAKTGSAAANVGRAATRRQLLEYLHVFDVDGICLVDVEEERIHSVGFSSGAIPEGGSGSESGRKFIETELMQ